MDEMVAVSEKILAWKIGMKNSNTEKQCKKLELVKILGWRIGAKIQMKKWKTGLTDEMSNRWKNWSRWKYSRSENQYTIRIGEKILGRKICVKNFSRQVGEMEAFGERILDPKINGKILDGKYVKWKIGIKNSMMENWCKNPESVKKN